MFHVEHPKAAAASGLSCQARPLFHVEQKKRLPARKTRKKAIALAKSGGFPVTKGQKYRPIALKARCAVL